MSDARHAPAALHSTLQREITLINEFIDILQDEANILADGADSEALIQITDQKNQFADQLVDATEQRNGMLVAMGYGRDMDGLERAASTHPEVADAVQQLLDRTAQARTLNIGNGQIIDRFLNHHKQALDVLRHLTGRSQLYDARGRTRPTASPRAGHSKSA